MSEEDLIKKIEDCYKGTVYSLLASSMKYDSEGRIIANQKPASTPDTATSCLHLDWAPCVSGIILPAIYQINFEHQHIDLILREFTKENLLIREGREDLFVQGLLFGFQKKWHLSLSILAIQFEDSLRYILEKKGYLSTKMNDNFTQEERGTSRILTAYKTQLQEIFGSDMYFHLKTLLIKDDHGVGVNLRNRVAHGLLSQSDFEEIPCIYLWSLIFKLIINPPKFY